MTQKTAKSFIGDTEVLISGVVEGRDISVGWPGSAETENVFVVASNGEQIDITELINSIVAQGSGIWDNLSQSLFEEQ